MTITYRVNPRIVAEDALDVYRRSGLERPQDVRRIENMLRHSNVIVTAWDGTNLIGLLRAMTDFSFDCYLNDLAVDAAYQRRGIGREMIERLKADDIYRQVFPHSLRAGQPKGRCLQ